MEQQRNEWFRRKKRHSQSIGQWLVLAMLLRAQRKWMERGIAGARIRSAKQPMEQPQAL
jgi:hypothetical protein